MRVYLAKDENPDGGYYSAFSWKPDMRFERRSISEIREIEMADELWHFLLNEGGLPVDPDGSHDDTWLEWWPDGKTVWARPEPK